MKSYEVKEPKFSNSIQITETTDPGYADHINAAPKQLLENTLSNRNEIDNLREDFNNLTPENIGALSLKKGGTVNNTFIVDKKSTTNPSDVVELDISANEKVKINTLGSKDTLAAFTGNNVDGVIDFKGNIFNIYSNIINQANNTGMNVRYGSLAFRYAPARTQTEISTHTYTALELKNDSVIIGESEDYNLYTNSFIAVKRGGDIGAEIKVHTKNIDVHAASIQLNGSAGNIKSNNDMGVSAPNITFRTHSSTGGSAGASEGVSIAMSDDTVRITDNAYGDRARFGEGISRIYGDNIGIGNANDFFITGTRNENKGKDVRIKGGRNDLNYIHISDTGIDIVSRGYNDTPIRFIHADSELWIIDNDGWLMGDNFSTGYISIKDGGYINSIHNATNTNEKGTILGTGYYETYLKEDYPNKTFSLYNRSQDNVKNLGDATYKWTNIYATNGTIQTSDRNEKNTINELTAEKAQTLIYGLKPSTYQMNSGSSGRTHWGMISQDIEELLEGLGWTSHDFAGFIKSPKMHIEEEERDENGNIIKERVEEVIEGEYNYSLRYDEFIAPMIKVIQIQHEEIQNQTQRIEALEKRLELLEQKLLSGGTL